MFESKLNMYTLHKNQLIEMYFDYLLKKYEKKVTIRVKIPT